MAQTVDIHSGNGIVATVPGHGIIQAAGTTVPTDGDEGYSPGCLFQHLDGGDGTALYVNEGTRSSCDFNALNGA